MAENRPHKTMMIVLVALIPACAFSAFLFTGCGGRSLRQRVEEIDGSFRRGSSRISELTGFFSPLEEFDFENAAFLSDVLGALGRSRQAADTVRASLEELGGYEYKGELACLGEHVDAYVTDMSEVLDDLEQVYAGLEGILKSVEPALKEEAEVTQMEAPRSNEEWLARLYALDAALEPSVSGLSAVEVAPVLAEYKALMMELMARLHKLIRELIPVASGSSPNIEQEENPDFLRIQELKSAYPGVVKGMRDRLGISGVDPLIERVELEINRLYLEVTR